MLRITTKIDCDSCGRTIEVEWQTLPDESDIASNLGRMGWTTKNDNQLCPDCLKDIRYEINHINR